MTTEIIRDRKVLSRKIGSIKGRGRKLDADIHLSGVSCLYHAGQHGDTTLLSRLCLAMPRSARGKALMTWAEHFAPLRIDRKTCKVTLTKDWLVDKFQIDKADATPFWDFTQETEPKDFTVKSLVAMLQRIAKGNTEKAPADADAKQAALKAIKAIRGAKAVAAIEEELTEAQAA